MLTEEEKEEQTTVLLRRLPRKLKREFKGWCSLNETNMTEAIYALMEESVKRGSPLADLIRETVSKKR